MSYTSFKSLSEEIFLKATNCTIGENDEDLVKFKNENRKNP